MAKRKFNPGDLVTLKTGGPIMIINTRFDDGGVQCLWHLETGELQREGLHTVVLEHVDAKAPVKAVAHK